MTDPDRLALMRLKDELADALHVMWLWRCDALVARVTDSLGWS